MKNLIQFKIAIIFLMVIINSGCAITDSRLSGTWRSDLELTRKFNEEHVILTDKQKKNFTAFRSYGDNLFKSRKV